MSCPAVTLEIITISQADIWTAGLIMVVCRLHSVVSSLTDCRQAACYPAYFITASVLTMVLDGNCPFAGEVVSIHHYREAEHEHAPAVIGSGALLAASNEEFKTRPCGFRFVLLLELHCSSHAVKAEVTANLADHGNSKNELKCNHTLLTAAQTAARVLKFL